MTAVIFALKTELRQRLDLSPLIPGRIEAMDLPDIASLELQYGNRKRPAGHFFELEIRPGGQGLRFTRGDARFDYLGRGMASGAIEIEGDAGAYLGYRMRGGILTVGGDAGIYCGAEMKGGEIHVRGNAGDFLGAALPGNKKGMAGGVVIVRGRAGDRVGDHMRRGLIVIDGDAGAYAAARMTAGTIAVGGRLGAHPGYAMKRGTLLVRRAPDALPPTFNDCGTHTLGFLPLLLKSQAFAGTGFSALAGPPPRVRRYAGDQAAGGLGEILVLV